MPWFRLLVVVAVLAVSPASVLAQAPASPDEAPAAQTPDDRATSFRAVSGAEAEGVPGGTLMVVSYGIVWLFLMLFLFRVGRLSAAVRVDVERLSATLEARSGDGDGGA